METVHPQNAMQSQQSSVSQDRTGPLHKSVTIALVAGEVSGDLLGGALIKALREHYPYAKFVGVGGSEMQAQGLESWFSMDTLSVMGIAAVLKRLPKLLELRSQLVRKIVTAQPAVFIGIDAPDFNLGLAKRLKTARVKTVHYVSPSVWAWRQNRVVSIAHSVDLMLTLFPFEREFYLRHGVASAFVGHPAADELPLVVSQQKYRSLVQGRVDKNSVQLGNSHATTYDLNAQQALAVLPGSRRSEIAYLMPIFFKTLVWLHSQRPELVFIVACVNAERKTEIEAIQSTIPGADRLPVVLLEGGSKAIMGACDGVLLSSGTATLEAMLLKKPMVVAYKWHWLTHFVISRLVKIPHFALPNILANKVLVPEFIQENATADKIGPAVLDALNQENKSSLVGHFAEIHQTLSGGASARAAAAIVELLQGQAKSAQS